MDPSARYRRSLRHTADNKGNTGGFTRNIEIADGTNQIHTLAVGNGANPPKINYSHDYTGNLTSETSSRHFEWDHSNQMRAFRIRAGNAEPAVHAHYLYDAQGTRVKKLVRKQGGSFATTAYIDGIFEHHRWQGSGQAAAGENGHLHVMDGEQRITLVRVGATHPDDQGPATQFHLDDHLGSSTLVLAQDGSLINREEYTPYGETSFGAFARKRYRFVGKERDKETGLYYIAARYYSPWLSRWTAPDPDSVAGGVNVYRYANNNPIGYQDPTGRQPETPKTLSGRLFQEIVKAWVENYDEYERYRREGIPSLDTSGNVVPWNSAAAHWPIR
jgi:RHS repeat-associated protein